MKILRWILFIILIVVIAATALLAFAYNSITTAPLPQTDGELTVAGLNEPVTVIRDAYGVPHIYASNTYDLLFAQGFTQAQDRWWQMEFFRHVGQGRIQELTGSNESLLATDIYIRSAGWGRAAQRDYDEAPEDVKVMLQAFADGVNAYLDSRTQDQLAVEYRLLGLAGVTIEVEPWSPVHTLAWGKVMSNDLGGNADFEELYSRLLANLPEDMVADYIQTFAYDEKPTIMNAEDLELNAETASTGTPDQIGIIGLDSAIFDRAGVANGLAFGRGNDIGSNNWVVSGDKTASGLPLLADDPHLGIQMPSIWYEIGLHCQPVSDECPFNVVGFTFSPVMNVVVGHNDTIAWGVTNVGWDTQDLYQIEVNPDNPLQYRWNDEWRDMIVHDEIIRAGDTDETVTIQVRETHLGPIINDHELDENGQVTGFNNENPLAFKWTSSAEASTLLQSVIKLNRASNWDEFRDALRYWDSASQNVVYADIEGNIGYQMPGRVPIRAEGHTGLLPVDGTTDAFEWLGYVPFENLPSVFNPAKGYMATANQAPVPLEFYEQLSSQLGDEFGEDSHYTFGYLWAPGYRGQRIHEMIEATDAHTIESFQQIHGDNKAIYAEEIAPYLADLTIDDSTLADMRDWLLDWDYAMNADSAPAALFAVFWDELHQAVFADELENVDVSYRRASYWPLVLLMRESDNVWWDDISTEDTESRDEILLNTLAVAVERAGELMGEDRDTWSWGQLHTATFVSNPLGASGISLIEDAVNRGPVGVGGGSAIVNATGWRVGDDFSVRSVPSMRMIIDLADFDNSVTMNTTGQSGHPFDEHYDSLIDSWATVEYKPMLFTRERVEADAASTLTLQPE